MTTTRFADLRLPFGFTYADHPFIDHNASDFVITVDEDDGWKVVKPNKVGVLTDIAFFPMLKLAIDFVLQVTNDNPKLRFYERDVEADNLAFYPRHSKRVRFEPSVEATTASRW